MQWQSLEIKGSDLLPRYGAASAIIGDTVYIVGGSYGSSGRRQREFQSYNLSKSLFFLWAVVNIFKEENTVRDEESQGDYLSVRFGTCVAWENQLFLWGGEQQQKEAVSQITSLKLGQIFFLNLFTYF